MRKKVLFGSIVFCCVFLWGINRIVSVRQDKLIVSEVYSDGTVQEFEREEVLNLENSPLYAAIMAADDEFETTYVPQPNMLAPRKAAIVTCMDHRLNDFLSKVTPGTYILRNAGARVTEDWIRSLVILYKLFEVEEIFLIQHTDCGMQKFTDDVMRDLLVGSSTKAKLVKNCNVALEPVESNNVCTWENTDRCCSKGACVGYKGIDWRTIKHGLFESVLEDVKLIRNHALIPSNIPVYGFIFDVITGDLIPVPKAMEAGKAKPLQCK
jgi:carbonic anhydrase